MALDNNLRSELGKLVETLTHTGQKILDQNNLKKLKNICKKSDGYVEHVYHLLIYQLERPHSEIRYSAFQICDELFRRSHCFRELIVSNLQHVMELTCETSDNRLPPPRPVAVSLKRLGLLTIQEWNKQYGEGYKKLKLGYNFLKHCKKVDFSTIQVENSAVLARRREEGERQSVVNKEKLKKVTKEISELQPEINSTLTSLENCIALLLPTPEDFFICDKEEDMIGETKNTTVPVKRCTEKKVVSETRVSRRSSDEITETVSNEAKPSTSRTEEEFMEVESSDSENEDSEVEKESIDFREYGIVNSKYSIEVSVNTGVPSIKETAENAAIFENAKDLHVLIISKYLPVVKKWIQVITKTANNKGSDQLKNVIDLKHRLEKATSRYVQLKEHAIPNVESDSSDSDFEEVEEKEGYEEVVKEEVFLPMPSTDFTTTKVQTPASKKNLKSWSIWSEENNEKDPTSAQSTLLNLKTAKSSISTDLRVSMNTVLNSENPNIKDKVSCKETDSLPSTSEENTASTSEENRKTKLLAVAPKVPFDIDLYHWEDEKVEVPTMLAVRAEGSRFWNTTQEELEAVPVPDGVKSIRTRVIEFTGKFEPVRWSCRAPLPSGKLCPRKDRYKCPFHGPVVPRDKMGQCSNPEDAEKIAKEEEKGEKCPDWQDPQLLEDIKNATGVDLKLPEKKGKKRRKTKKEEDKFPGLTNIKQNTVYTRLSKKIFKKDAIKRVTRTLDSLDHNRFRDKYGDQFHYMYNTA